MESGEIEPWSHIVTERDIEHPNEGVQIGEWCVASRGILVRTPTEDLKANAYVV